MIIQTTDIARLLTATVAPLCWRHHGPIWCLRLTTQTTMLGAFLTVAGCTLGNYGALVAHYTYTETAVVLDIHSVGFQLRPSGPDAGATLGYRHASYVFPRGGPQRQPAMSRWRWFGALWPAGTLIMRASTSVGLEVQTTPDIARLALGYLDQVLTPGPAPQMSQVVHLFYPRNMPHYTYVYFQEERNAPMDETDDLSHDPLHVSHCAVGPGGVCEPQSSGVLSKHGVGD